MRPASALALAAVASLTLAAAPPGPGSSSLTDTTDLAEVAGSGTSVDTAAPGDTGDGGDGSVATAGSSAQGQQELTGTFAIAAGQCGDGAVTSGSYFRMQNQAGGYVGNGSSPCGDETYTPLRPGTDGGLVTGDYQPHPDPAFDGGDALANRITRPEAFFGTDFSTATNATDPQTGTQVAAPSIVHDGQGGLSGDLRAFAAAWNGQHFNQGAPKPDGSRPGGTAGPTGTYDPDTGAFTLEWSSRIQGGPFNGFTGQWHLTGTFQPAEGGGAAAQTGSQEDGTQDQSQQDQDGDTDDQAAGTQAGSETLPATGPGLPTALGLGLLATAGLVAARRRPASGRGGR